MKALAIIAILLFAGIAGYGQCQASAGFQCVAQSDMDRIAKDLNELKALKDAYSKLLVERGLSAAERDAAANAIKIAGDTITVLQKGIADRESVIALQQTALKLYSDLVEKLTAKINAPKSAWAKFLEAVKDVAYIASGILIGRAIP